MGRTSATHDAAVQCNHCEIKTGGTEDDNGHLHCGECGAYAEETEDYCVKHSVDYGRLTGYDHCPRCRQESDIQQRRQEQQARRSSERMHSMVDAPRF